MRTLILVTALLLGAPARADFGPEVLIGPQAGHQRSPDIASDGKSFLVAWRNDASAKPAMEALLVAPDGSWSGAPVQLASLRGAGSPPAVAACGQGWVVTWAEPDQVAMHVLDRAGAPLFSLEEKLDPRAAGGPISRPGLACDQHGALVVWGSRNPPELRALLLPHGATAARRLRLFAEDGPGAATSVAATSDDDGFLVAWHAVVSGSGQDGARQIPGTPRTFIAALSVAPDGTLRERRPVPVAEEIPAVGSLAAASAGRGDFLVAWNRAGQQGPLFAARLRGSRVVDAQPLTVGGGSTGAVSATADRAGYLLAWTGGASQGDFGRELRLARLPIQGARIGESSLHASQGHVGEVRLAVGAGRVIAAYAEGQLGPLTRAASLDVWVKGAGGSPPATLLTRGPAPQRTPALAGRAADYLLAWVDESTDPESIRAAVVSPNGPGGSPSNPSLAPPRGIPIARSAAPRQISVAAGTAGYLVAWVDQRGVSAVRLSAAGEPAHPEPLRVSDGAPNVAASFDGEAYVLAFSQGKNVHSARIFEDGRPPEPKVLLGDAVFGPAVVGNACERGACLVTWTRHNAYYGYEHVYGLRVIHGRPEYLGTYARQLIEPEGFAQRPAVAAGGGRFAAAWTAYSSGSDPRRILWRNMDRMADGRGDRAGDLPGRRAVPPALAFDGRRFVAAWVEQDDPDPLRWSFLERGWWGESVRSLGVKGTALALGATPGGGLTAAWVETPSGEPGRVRLRTLVPSGSPEPPPAPPPLETFRLPDLLARIRVSAARRGGDRVDLEIDRMVRALVARVQSVTLRGRLPVDLRQLPGRAQPESGPVKYRSPWGSEISSGGLHVMKAHYTGPAVALGAAYGAAVVVDGSVRIGSLADSVVLATGDVDIAHCDRSVVVAGGRIEISGDGSMLSNGRGFASILVSGRRIDAGSYGGVLAAADGVVAGNAGIATVNTPAARIAGASLEAIGAAAYMDPGLVLSDAAEAPELPLQFEAALATQSSDARRRGAYLFRRGEPRPAAWGREGQPLRGLGGPLAEALAGFEVAFAAPMHVVLRRGPVRVDLAPSRPALEPPAAQGLSLPPDVEAHAVGVYLSARADGVVTVEVDRPGPPLLLVLTAYETVRWKVQLSAGTSVAGVVLGGVHAPDGLDGLPPGTPVLSRVNDYGEKYLYDYPGRTDSGPGVRELVRELTGKDPASFQGAERGDHYRIGPPTTR